MPVGRCYPDPSPCEAPPAAAGRVPSPWTPIMAAYVLYVAASFAIGIAGGERQFIGAMAFLAFLAVHAAPRLLPPRWTGLTLAATAAALLAIIALLAGTWAWGAPSPPYAAKYFALLLLVVIADALQLPPLFRAPARRWGLGAVAVVLVLGACLGVSEDRIEGSYANPNNFALAAMSLLFFLDPDRDPPAFKLALHAFVVGLILLSGTAGALMGYLVGLGFSWLRSRFARALLLVAALGALLGLLWLPQRPADLQILGEAKWIGPLWTKVMVVQDHFAEIAANDPLDFWKLGQEYGGAELTSAAWRLEHWRTVLRIFQDSGALAQWFGQGPGACSVLLVKLPHNDYLRLLVEAGLLGCAAGGAIWIMLYRRAAPSVRWLAIMMATYAITENNLDNFTVMSLFVLFFVSAGAGSGTGPVPPETA